MKNLLIIEDEHFITDRIKELIDQIKKDVPNFVLLGIYSFEDKEAGIKIVNCMQGDFKPIPDIKDGKRSVETGDTGHTKSIFLKGKYFEHVDYKDITKRLLRAPIKLTT